MENLFHKPTSTDIVTVIRTENQASTFSGVLPTGSHFAGSMGRGAAGQGARAGSQLCLWRQLYPSTHASCPACRMRVMTDVFGLLVKVIPDLSVRRQGLLVAVGEARELYDLYASVSTNSNKSSYKY